MTTKHFKPLSELIRLNPEESQKYVETLAQAGVDLEEYRDNLVQQWDAYQETEVRRIDLYKRLSKEAYWSYFRIHRNKFLRGLYLTFVWVTVVLGGFALYGMLNWFFCDLFGSCSYRS